MSTAAPSLENEKDVYRQDGAERTNANERRRAALQAVDEQPFNWRHVKTCLVAGESPSFSHPFYAF